MSDNDTVRVFAAICPSEVAHAELEAFLEPRREVESTLRWTPSHLWHVTLAFMAEVPEDALDDVVEAIATAAATIDPIRLRLEGAGVFPDVADARVVWMDVRSEDPEGRAELTRLAHRTRIACAQVGASPAGGDYTPHLTLARSRRPFGATDWLQVIDSHTGPTWLADEVTVFVSRRPRDGRPYYVAEATCPLGTVSLSDG